MVEKEREDIRTWSRIYLASYRLQGVGEGVKGNDWDFELGWLVAVVMSLVKTKLIL